MARKSHFARMSRGSGGSGSLGGSLRSWDVIVPSQSESRPRYIRATGPHASRRRGSADEEYHTPEQKPRREQPRRGEPRRHAARPIDQLRWSLVLGSLTNVRSSTR